MVCYNYTVREQPLEAEITDSTCCLFWHVTLHAAQREKLQTRIKIQPTENPAAEQSAVHIVFY